LQAACFVALDWKTAWRCENGRNAGVPEGQLFISPHIAWSCFCEGHDARLDDLRGSLLDVENSSTIPGHPIRWTSVLVLIEND
jgi:hypothetical protein